MVISNNRGERKTDVICLKNHILILSYCSHVTHRVPQVFISSHEAKNETKPFNEYLIFVMLVF